MSEIDNHERIFGIKGVLEKFSDKLNERSDFYNEQFGDYEDLSHNINDEEGFLSCIAKKEYYFFRSLELSEIKDLFNELHLDLLKILDYPKKNKPIL